MAFDTIILGAGAAGLMAACQAPGRCLILDHAKRPGEKIRISGGGRCNFTNLDIQPERFLSSNVHFHKSALSRYTQWDFIDWVARTGIAYHEKTLGQLFCDGKSQAIIDMLLEGVEDAGARLETDARILSVEKTNDGYQVAYDKNGTSLTAQTQNVIVATGGKSIPKMGATGIGLSIAASFDIPVLDTKPGLVPFTLSGPDLDLAKSIAGISTSSSAKIGAVSFEEGVLMTHRGISGPAALQISSYWSPGQSVEFDLAQGMEIFGFLMEKKHSQGKKSPQKVLAQILPERLVNALMVGQTLPANLADLSKAHVSQITDRIKAFTVTPPATEGYRTAEVMVGGINTDALNSKTMEAKNHPGLYFIGECVDVTGWLGGYNFQWAWSSGAVAGQAIRTAL